MSSVETFKDGHGDTWEFFKDKRLEWRWRRKAKNGQIIGAATEGYKNKKDCYSNATRMGFTAENS